MKKEILTNLVSVNVDGASKVDPFKLCDYLLELSDIFMEVNLCQNVDASSAVYAYIHQACVALDFAAIHISDLSK